MLLLLLFFAAAVVALVTTHHQEIIKSKKFVAPAKKEHEPKRYEHLITLDPLFLFLHPLLFPFVPVVLIVGNGRSCLSLFFFFFSFLCFFAVLFSVAGQAGKQANLF